MVDFVEKQKAFQDFVVACTGLSESKVIWGGQQGPRPTQPAIVLKMMFTGDNNRPWVDTENNPLVIDPLTVTASGASDTFTATGHGLGTGDGPFNLVGSDLPLNTAEDTNYWVVVVDANTFKLATSLANAINVVPVIVDLGDDGSGAMTLESTDDTLTFGEEIVFKQRSLIKGILTVECYAATGTGNDMAQSILWRIHAKRLLPSIMDILGSKNIAITSIDPVRFIEGTQDLVLFEPRAWVDIRFHTTSEESEYGGIVETVEITDEEYGEDFTVP